MMRPRKQEPAKGKQEDIVGVLRFQLSCLEIIKGEGEMIHLALCFVNVEII